ncbi:MAG: DUF1501 domain-containing protein [Pirellulaceae bacterium]
MTIVRNVTRREILQSASTGFGWMALAGLLSEDARAATTGRSPEPHFHPKIASVIFCFMDGGPSHVDTFDPKPMLRKHAGEKVGDHSTNALYTDRNRMWLPSPWEFRQRGDSGLWVSDLFPHIATVADEICVIRSMVGHLPLHGQQNLLLHTGRVTGQHPSFGAWVSYGLGTENRDLPGFVLLNNDWVPNGGMENFGGSYLPASHQATMVRAKGAPMDNIVPADTTDIQRRKLAMLAKQNAAFAEQASDADKIEGAIANYETAFRMQTALPEVVDISRETARTQAMYGIGSTDPHQNYYAMQTLRARRLVEAGVRFVEITCPSFDGNNSPWDQHGTLKANHEKNARITDQSVASLILDLKQRGLLDQTLVVWAGEMGRTPHSPGTDGRDHHINGYSIFMAGGGVRRGIAYGTTNAFGEAVEENPVTIHDVHATVLHLLGIDHERLTYRHGGRDHRLTDVHGRMLREILV